MVCYSGEVRLVHFSRGVMVEVVFWNLWWSSSRIVSSLMVDSGIEMCFGWGYAMVFACRLVVVPNSFQRIWLASR